MAKHWKENWRKCSKLGQCTSYRSVCCTPVRKNFINSLEQLINNWIWVFDKMIFIKHQLMQIAWSREAKSRKKKNYNRGIIPFCGMIPRKGILWFGVSVTGAFNSKWKLTVHKEDIHIHSGFVESFQIQASNFLET